MNPVNLNTKSFTKVTPDRGVERKQQIVLSQRGKKLPDLVDAPAKEKKTFRPLPATPVRSTDLIYTNTNSSEETTGTSASDKSEFESVRSETSSESIGDSIRILTEAKAFQSPISKARKALKPLNFPSSSFERNHTNGDRSSFAIRRIELNTTYEENDFDGSPKKPASSAKRAAFRSSKNTPIRTGRMALVERRAKVEEPNKDAERFESSSSTTEGEHSIASLRRFAGPLPERDPSPAKKTVLDRILSPRNAIREAKAEKIRARNEAKAAKLRPIRATLPADVVLDDNGNLSGTTYLSKTPKFQEGGLPQFPGREDMEFETYFNQVSNEALNKDLADAGTQRITTQARVDFFRLDYEFLNDDGTAFFRSYDLDIAKSKQNERNAAVAQALRQYSGSDAATTVLSSVLHQSVAATIARGLRSADGFAMEHLRLISAMNTTGREIYLVNADGSRSQIDNPLGIAGAKFRVYKQDNKFKVSIGWQMYFEAKPDQEALLPLGKNEVIAVNCEAVLFVDEDTAHTVVTDDQMKEHNLMALTIPNEGIKATFSGRLKLD